MFSRNHLALRLVRLRSDEQWTDRPNGLVFIFPQAGAATFGNGAEENRPLAVGDVLILSDTAAATFVRAGAEGLAFWCFALSIEQMYPLFSVDEIGLLQNVIVELKSARHHAGNGELAMACHRMIAETPDGFDVNHRSQLLRIAASILSNEFKNAKAYRVGMMRPDENVMRVFEGLTTQELLSLSVAELAGRFNCSKRHLNRLFHQHFGFSVAGMRMEMRLLKAISLLRDPCAKIINVAEQCGFNHLGLFNTCFKRRFGISPGQWRKRDAEDREANRVAGVEVCPLKSNGLCPLSNSPDAPQPSQQCATQGKTAPARLLVTLKGLSPKNARPGADGGDGPKTLSFRAQIIPPRATRLGP